MAIYVAPQYFFVDWDNYLATFLFYVAILDLSIVMNKTEK